MINQLADRHHATAGVFGRRHTAALAVLAELGLNGRLVNEMWWTETDVWTIEWEHDDNDQQTGFDKDDCHYNRQTGECLTRKARMA